MYDAISFLHDALFSFGQNNPISFGLATIIVVFLLGPRVLKSLTKPSGKPWGDVLDLNKRITQPSRPSDTLANLLATPFNILIFYVFAVLSWLKKRTLK